MVSRSRCQRDHPRVCGKNSLPMFAVTTVPGSPPRVREKPVDCSKTNPWTRITPACAGKTQIEDSTDKTKQDHPRVCGKNSWYSCIRNTLRGSPPRVREKRYYYFMDYHRSRITPACAGKTPISQTKIVASQDHPRVCGKNKARPINTRVSAGSPPRVREKHREINTIA